MSRASLEELMNIRVTTASRESEGALTTAARVVVVTAAQIERRGYRSLLEVLEDLPDVKVDLNTDADAPAEMTVQGVRGATRIIVQLDGFRVSAPTNEPLPILANYPVHEARQIEIVYGPSSSIYGADAFSAVINIITASAAEAPGFRASTSAGQDGLFNNTIRYAASLGKGVSLRLAGQYFSDQQPDLSALFPGDFGGQTGQKTGVYNTIFGPMTSPDPASPDYDTPMSAHSLHGMLDFGNRLAIRFFESHVRTPNALPYSFDNAVYNPEAFQRNNLLSVAGVYRRESGRWRSLTTLSATRQELDPESGYWNVYSNLTRSYKYAYGRSLRAMQQTTWRPSPSRTLIFGGAVTRTLAFPQGADLNARVTSRGTPGTILGTTIVDEFNEIHETNTGAFVQLLSPLGPLSLTAGARGDYNSRYGGTFNPRVGLVAQRRGTVLKLLFGTAYLAPSAFESFQHYGAFWTSDGGRTYESGYWHVPNPDLRPQHKTTLETSLRHPLSSGLSVSASAFVSRLTNLIKPYDADRSGPGTFLGWPVAYMEYPVNEGRGTMYGGTLSLDLLARPRGDWRIEASAAISLADGRFRHDDDVMTTTPVVGMVPVRGQLTADLDFGRWSAAPRLAILGRQRTGAMVDAAGAVVTHTIDGYSLLDVNFRRKDVAPGADVFLTIDNATDARYRHVNLRAYERPEEFIGVPQNPRRVTVGLSIRVPR